MIDNVVTVPETPWLVKRSGTATADLEWMDPSVVLNNVNVTDPPPLGSKRTYVKWEDSFDPLSSTTRLINKKITKILSLDGGGVRAYFTLVLLAKLENDLKEPLVKIFDILAGVSIGSVIALGLSIPSGEDPTKPKYTAQYFLDNFPKIMEKIFPYGDLATLAEDARLFEDEPFFTDDGINEIGKKYVGATLVKDALKEVVVPVFKPGMPSLTLYVPTSTKHPHFEGLTMAKLAMMSSAAIPYLPTQEYKGARFNDGGFGANNPVLGALAMAQDSHSEKVVCSFGTGISSTEYEANPKCGTGIFSIASSLLGMTMNAAQQGINEAAKKIVGKNYFRVEQVLQKPVSLDDARPENLAYLKKQAEEWFDEPDNQDMWREMVKKLEPTESYIC
jgi:patatin-like phospholipase/acyl hydrolase